MLKLENVSKVFNEGTVNEKVIFNNFNLKVSKGEFVVVIGSNGSGKSTLMNLIAGKLKPDTGKILVNGVNMFDKPEHVHAKQIGKVFQDPLMGTVSNMSIYENLALAEKKGKKVGLKKCISKHDLEKYKKIVASLNLGLENNLNNKVGLLSGGQRQALTLLMATMKNPKILLLDEHTSALDPKTAQKVLEQTNKIIKKSNLTTLMITHNMNDAIKFGTRLIMMSKGKIVLDVFGKEKESLSTEFLLNRFASVS